MSKSRYRKALRRCAWNGLMRRMGAPSYAPLPTPLEATATSPPGVACRWMDCPYAADGDAEYCSRHRNHVTFCVRCDREEEGPYYDAEYLVLGICRACVSAQPAANAVIGANNDAEDDGA